MHSKRLIPFIVLSLLSAASLFNCATPNPVKIEPPPLPEGVMSARWGSSVEEIKKTIDTEGVQWFQDKTETPPHALYASGNYMNTPAIFSYFFTPHSRKLYKVTLTFDDPMIYAKARDDLIRKFGPPSFSQPDVDHWSWEDKSLVILQKDPSHVQVSYSSGPFLILNHEEQEGSVRK